MVKCPRQNSVPFLKVAAISELQVENLPIVLGEQSARSIAWMVSPFRLFQPESREFLLPVCEH